MLFCNPAGCLQPSEQKTEKPRFFGRRRKAHSRLCERALARPKADSMGRPVWNRTYSAVIPCIRVQPPTASSHIGRIKKGMARPFPRVPWYSITPIWKMQQVFSKKFVKKAENQNFFPRIGFGRFSTARCCGWMVQMSLQISEIRHQKSDAIRAGFTHCRGCVERKSASFVGRGLAPATERAERKPTAAQSVRENPVRGNIVKRQKGSGILSICSHRDGIRTHGGSKPPPYRLQQNFNCFRSRKVPQAHGFNGTRLHDF